MIKKGQIWVETVLYTLIFLILMGLVLSFAKPKLEEISDKAMIEQSISVMETIDNAILSVVQGGPGNRRKIDLTLNKGKIKIDSNKDQVLFELDSKHAYTEIGKDVEIGRVISKTEELGKINKVTLTINYNYNITYDDEEKIKTISSASTPYKLFITNKGGNTTKVDFEIK
jgi:hypothetical protein